MGAVLFHTNPPDRLKIPPQTQVKKSLELAEPAPSEEFDEAARQVSVFSDDFLLAPQVAFPAVASPPSASVPSRWLFDEYAKEIAMQPEKLKDLQKLRGKFVDRFPMVPLEWGTMRDWLNETFPGETGRTRRNRFDSL